MSLFFQIKPKEYDRMLSRIQDVISQSMMYDDKLFYISEEFHIIFDNNQHSLNLFQWFEELELVFMVRTEIKEFNFKTGYLIVDSENREKNKHYSDLVI